MPVIPKIESRLLSPAQQQKVEELVKLHHYSLIIELMGEKAVAPIVLEKVKAAGLYREPRSDVIRRSFMFGGSSLLEPDVLDMSQAEFDHWVAKKGLTVDPQQAEVIESVRESFTGYLKSYADEMVSHIEKALAKGNRGLRRKLAQYHHSKLERELEHRKALASLAKDLTAISENSMNNAIRVFETETNNAFQDGRALEIVKKAGNDNPWVFKRPRHDACEACVRAYLQEDGKTPKLFKLQDLVANGSNIGKSRADRMPVLESFHPFCSCVTEWLPPGFGFNSRGRMEWKGNQLGALGT